MTKEEAIKENEQMKKDILTLKEKIGNMEETSKIGEYFSNKHHDEDFRKIFIDRSKKKLKKYDFLSPAFEKIFKDLLYDTCLMESNFPIVKALIENDLVSVMTELIKYAEWWDSTEHDNSRLYFEGKFDKEEK